jgi:hypothetical protein
MRIAVDIGGVISKYPEEFEHMMRAFRRANHDVFVVTDMHDKSQVVETLAANAVEIKPEFIYCADYEKYGDACKAVLLRELRIDVLFDDHPGYLVWPWPTPAPLRLRVEPDPRMPYWAKTWVCPGGEFGRRCFMDDNPDDEIDS